MTAPTFVCPRCRGGVTAGRDHYHCPSCATGYPVIGGIPDFRVCAGAYLSIEEDRAKARRVAAAGASFTEMLRAYYAMTPEVPAADAARYTRHHLSGVERGHHVLERFAAYGLREVTAGRMIDVGCGTGGLIVAATGAGYEVTGADIALRWLVIAGRRLEERGVSASLICACADHLPFTAGTFDTVVAENLLEHTEDHGAVLREITRIGRPEGGIMLRSVNRLAFARDPHVGLWGVGLLPRSMAARYVRRRTGALYAVRSPAYWGLRRAVARLGRNVLTVRPPLLLAHDIRSRSGLEKLSLRVYTWLSARVPFVRPLLALIGPYLDIVTPPRPRSFRDSIGKTTDGLARPLESGSAGTDLVNLDAT